MMKTHMQMKKWLVIGFLLSCNVSALAQQTPSKPQEIDVVYSRLSSVLPVEGQILTLPYAESIGHYGALASGSLNTNSDALGGSAYEITIAEKGRNPYDAGAFLPIASNIEKGDMIYVFFFAKSLSQSNARFDQVALQLGSAPYTPSFSRRFSIATEWQPYVLAGTAKQDFQPGASQLSIQLAGAKQQVALGSIFVLNLGKNVGLDTLPFLND